MTFPQLCYNVRLQEGIHYKATKIGCSHQNCFAWDIFLHRRKEDLPPISQPLLLLPTKKESLCCLFGSPIFQSSPTDWITDLTCVLPLPDSYLHSPLTKLFLWGGSSPRHGRRLCPEVFQNLQGGHATEVSLQWSNIQKALEALKQTNEV
jgi:hypothetical protein